MRIGSHVSIRGGYLQAAKTALAIGAESFQYFPKNPRGLTIKTFDAKDAEACARFCREHGLFSIGHAPYPANLAVESPELRAATAASLLNDLEISEACGSIGVVVHFGKSKEKDPLQGYRNVIQCLNETLSRWQGRALLLIENQAGEGTTMGTTMEELAQVRKLCDYPDKIGFCLDTCHAFAGGLWRGNDWAKLEEKGQALGFFARLKAVHLNDSVYPFGSRKDRHANIGRGRIGEEGFRELLRSPLLEDVPGILETKTGADRTHRGEIAYLRSLLRKSGRGDDAG